MSEPQFIPPRDEPSLQLPPVPVQPLGYSSLPPRSRPGVMTAVAILSIVIGGFGVLSALGSAISSVMMASITPPAPPPPPVAATGPTTAPAPAGTAVTFFSFQQNTPALVFGFVDAIARGGLAVLLIVAGVFVLRDRRVSRRLHLIWAGLRIPLALLSAAAYWLTMRQVFTTMPPAPGAGIPPGFVDSMLVVGIAMQLLIAWAYPAAVLIVLRTRTARTYYESLAE